MANPPPMFVAVIAVPAAVAVDATQVGAAVPFDCNM